MTRRLLFLSIYTLIVSLAALGLTKGVTPTANTSSANPAQAQAANPCGLDVDITGTALKGQQGQNDIVQVNWDFKNNSPCLKVDKSEVEVRITRGGKESIGKITINGGGTVATVLVPRVTPGDVKSPSTIRASVKATGSFTTTTTDSSQGLLSGN